MKIVAVFFISFFLIFPYPVFGQQNSEGFKEFDAITNRCKATMPGELCPEVAKNDSFFSSLFSTIIGLFWNVTSSANVNQAVEHAKNVDQTYIPIKEATDDAEVVLKNSLCGEGQTGMYTTFMPKFAEETASTEIKDCEEHYDTGLAPEGVNIIIP